MRLRKLRRCRWAAWLGVVALVLNALVPVHLAFDLAEAAAPAHRPGPEDGVGDWQWRVLAAVVGHAAAEHQDEHRHHHNRPDCPVCAAFGSLGGLTFAAAPQLTNAPAPAEPPPAAAVAERLVSAPTAAYRPRAPPAA